MSEIVKPCSNVGPSSPQRRQFLSAALLLSLAACSRKISSNLHGNDLSSMKLPAAFHLRDTDGNLRTLEDFRGNVVLLSFGYTHCPDVCPTTLARAAQIRQILGEQGKKLKVIFISVDPERDTPEILKAYTAAFDPTFIGLYGDATQTAEVAKSFGAYYRKVPSGNSYTMDHSALNYILDKSGEVRFALQYTETANDSAEDLRSLL